MSKYQNSLQCHSAFAKYVVFFLMHDCSSKSMVKEGGCKSEAFSSAKHIVPRTVGNHKFTFLIY